MEAEHTDVCAVCSLSVPIRGYVCAFCVREELSRIRKLPPAEVRPALHELDRAQFGYVMSTEEHMAAADKGLARIAENLRKLGIEIDDGK